MDKIEYRIFEVLTQSLGESVSINELSRRISNKLIYKNVYLAVKALEKEGQLTIESSGSASIPRLNLENFALTGKLAAFELEKLGAVFAKRHESIELLNDILRCGAPAHGGWCYTTEFVLLGRPKECLATNRWDLLISTEDLSGESNDDARCKNLEERQEIIRELQRLEKRHNAVIDALLISPDEFHKYLSSFEDNPVKDFIRDRVVLSGAEDFWRELQVMREKGLEQKAGTGQKLAKFSGEDLRFNFRRLGYSGASETATIERRLLCIESLIVSTLISHESEVRLVEAIPVILAKNAINHRLLFFLAKKHNLINKVGFLLDVTRQLLTDEQKKQEMDKIIPEYKKLKSETEERFTPDSKQGNWSIAREWNMVTNLSISDFKETMKLYNAA